MRVAGLDLGTNTCLVLVADVGIDGTIEHVLADEVRIVRLGQDVHKTRRLHPEALARAEETFKEFSAIIQKHGCEKVLACATSAARDVQNGQELVALAARYGIPVEIISGEREAELTFAGTFDRPLREPAFIIDVGGGSTEFILGDARGILRRESVDIGSVRLTELFVTSHPIPDSELAQMRDYISQKLQGLRERFATVALSAAVPVSGLRVVAVAGTPTTLASMDQGLAFESDRVQGHILTNEALENWLAKLAKMTVEQRRGLAGMEPKRADVIVAGAMTLLMSSEALGATRLEVSTRGLRYGVARSLATAGDRA